MSCRFASRTDEYHGWKCSESDGSCVFFVPNEQRCYDEYGEGPLAFEENQKEDVKEGKIVVGHLGGGMTWNNKVGIMESLTDLKECVSVDMEGKPYQEV